MDAAIILPAERGFLSREIAGGNQPRIAKAAVATAINSAKVDKVVDQLWPTTMGTWALVWVVNVMKAKCARQDAAAGPPNRDSDVVYARRGDCRAKTIIDVDDCDAGGATIQHREERGQPVEGSTVADTGRNRNDRNPDQSPHD